MGRKHRTIAELDAELDAAVKWRAMLTGVQILAVTFGAIAACWRGLATLVIGVAFAGVVQNMKAAPDDIEDARAERPPDA